MSHLVESGKLALQDIQEAERLLEKLDKKPKGDSKMTGIVSGHIGQSTAFPLPDGVSYRYLRPAKKMRLFLLPAVLGMAWPAGDASAACSLQLINSVPMQVADNVVSVPASVGTKEKQFQIDTAALDNQMGRDAMADFGLAAVEFTPSHSGGGAGAYGSAGMSAVDSGGRGQLMGLSGSYGSPGGANGNAIAIFNASGTMFHSWADAKPFALGAMQTGHLQFVVTDFPKPGSGGILSAGFFQKYDVDLNFWAHQLNMFAANHCQGQVLYWRAPGVAKLPIRYQSGRIIVRASVDGKEMDAVIDTGSPRSEMQIADAGRLFDIGASSPGVTPAGDGLYAYNFKTLSFGDVSIDNPHLVLTRGTLVRGAEPSPTTGSLIRGNADASSQPALVIGTDLLKLLHIYIAFNERMVYVTQGSELPEGDAKALPVVTVTPFRP